MHICSNCREENPEENEYCFSCGAVIEQTEVDEQEMPVQETTEDEALEEIEPEPAMDKAVLVLPDGSHLPLEDEVVFGRSNLANAVSPTEASWVSREHFTITRRNGKFYVEDRGSTNGTRLDGESLEGTEPRELREGDIITLADSIDLEFRAAE